MTDKIRSIVNSELLMLPYKFFDLDEAGKQKEQLESRHKVLARELFNRQHVLDKIRGKNQDRKSEDFKALASLYFQQFFKADGFDFELLDQEMREKRKVMERHLGKAWLTHLELLVKIAKELKPIKNQAPQGLLKKAI